MVVLVSVYFFFLCVILKATLWQQFLAFSGPPNRYQLKFLYTFSGSPPTSRKVLSDICNGVWLRRPKIKFERPDYWVTRDLKFLPWKFGKAYRIGVVFYVLHVSASGGNVRRRRWNTRGKRGAKKVYIQIQKARGAVRVSFLKKTIKKQKKNRISLLDALLTWVKLVPFRNWSYFKLQCSYHMS